jgi:hypothetical protein
MQAFVTKKKKFYAEYPRYELLRNKQLRYEPLPIIFTLENFFVDHFAAYSMGN